MRVVTELAKSRGSRDPRLWSGCLLFYHQFSVYVVVLDMVDYDASCHLLGRGRDQVDL